MKSTPTVIEAALECPLLTRARAVAAFVDLGTGRVRQAPAPPVTWADGDMLELRIDLDRFRPPLWLRVRLHAATTLTELHEIIQVLFDWDGDHMHVFTVDGVHYAHRASRNRRPGAAPNRPTCTGGRGDAPVEDWPDEEPHHPARSTSSSSTGASPTTWAGHDRAAGPVRLLSGTSHEDVASFQLTINCG